MSSYYYLYQAYQDQLYNAIVGLFILGVALALGWWVMMLMLKDYPRAQKWAGWVYMACCMMFYGTVAVMFA